MILTLDYELYGNGSGDVFRHIIEPTEKILKIADRHDAKLTIFFEVIEYWKLKEEWEKGNRMGYNRNPIEAMERQLKQAVAKGHEVQLHLHPQWVDAVWTANGWKVNNAKWRLGDYEGTGEDSLLRLLQRGKDTIEQMLGNGYRCEVLRAGGYNVQPSKELAEAMREVGLMVDSSIVPGAKETGSLSRYDYTGIRQDKGWWYCGEVLEHEAGPKKDLVELPVVAFGIVRLQKYLSIDRIKATLQNKKSAKDTFEAKTGQAKGGIIGKVQFFFQKESQTWDYCLFSKKLHRKFLKGISMQRSRDVFVLVGHPKSFVSGRGLEYLLKKVSGDYHCIGMSEYVKLCKR